jgi:hypothetical protein
MVSAEEASATAAAAVIEVGETAAHRPLSLASVRRCPTALNAEGRAAAVLTASTTRRIVLVFLTITHGIPL